MLCSERETQVAYIQWFYLIACAKINKFIPHYVSISFQLLVLDIGLGGTSREEVVHTKQDEDWSMEEGD
jgi:hypothetical protein